MTEYQFALFLENQVEILERIEQDIINDLPDELSETKTIEPFHLFGAKPKPIDIKIFPIMSDLRHYISKLKNSAEQAKGIAVKQKSKVQ